jgi:hypothetical protein
MVKKYKIILRQNLQTQIFTDLANSSGLVTQSGKTTIGIYSLVKYTSGSEGKIPLNDTEFKDILRVAKDAFGPFMSESEVEKVVIPNNLLWIASRDNTVVGFTASSYKHDTIYLAAAAIVISEQRKGLYHTFNRLRIEDGLNKNFSIFTTRTQNPNVERGITHALEVLKSEHLISGYKIKHDIIPGVYGRTLTRTVPRSYNEDINQTFSVLNYERGDAFYITFSVTK